MISIMELKAKQRKYESNFKLKLIDFKESNNSLFARAVARSFNTTENML